MHPRSSFPIGESADASARLDAAAAFLLSLPPSQPCMIVASTRGAADDLARRVAVARDATLGLSRFSLTQLASRLASARLAEEGVAPSTQLGGEAVAARVAFEAADRASLSYFADVAGMPGFPRALARTIGDLRESDVPATRVSGEVRGGADIARLLSEAERQYAAAATADRARLFVVATQAVPADLWLHAPLLLLDLQIESPGEARFVAALAARATRVYATVPTHDAHARQALEAAGGAVEAVGTHDGGVLDRLRTHLFADTAPGSDTTGAALQFFSAPGEGREAVEITRRILLEARRSVRFDEMAILVRAPQQYHGLLEHALQRAGVPAWFDRGTRRPHPAGRAFLALLACAAEGLSARRFAEYLSLGQLPDPGAAEDRWSASRDELLGGGPLDAAGDDTDAGDPSPRPVDDGDAAIAGTLRAPRRWEKLLVEASVIGGDPARWARRIDGLAEEFERRRRGLEHDEAQADRAEGIARDLDRLAQLRAFAVPLVEELARWPDRAPWADWVARFEAIAPRVLRTPVYVLRVLADLHPMGVVGPVSIHEVRGVLAERLGTVDAEPPARRYGRVFVGSPAQARGRAFRVVFVPGLAERMFPQKPRQDPLLSDAARARLDPRLDTRTELSRRERLLLHLAVGAATERLYVSYPRLDVAEGRVRVPSFYALDVMRGATGRIPDHDALAAAAAQTGDPSLAWPAPADASLAIDEQEHDLSVLRGLLDAPDPAEVRGHAQYLLRLNPALRRSVTDRWARAERRWTQHDGVTRSTEAIADALAAHRLGTHTYSLSALQRFAACPYQFLLGAIYRLRPSEQPAPLQRLDPLTRGSLVHAIQTAFFRALKARDALPVTVASLDSALATLEHAVGEVGASYEEALAPAIARVWRDELEAIARDLRAWVRQMSVAEGPWTPQYFELAFGLPLDPTRDPRSVADPITIDGRFRLRGSIDLVEDGGPQGALRVTDHKTGRDRHKESLVIGGGSVLQPVLYSLAVEQLLGARVDESRLSFCTSAGGYRIRPVSMTPESRRAGLEALEIIDRAVEQGTLPAAPAEGACGRCDVRAVCGPGEELRTARKPDPFLADLIALRSRP